VKDSGIYWLWIIVILAATALVYSQSLNYGPVNWDDRLVRTELHEEGINSASLRNILVPRMKGTYQPVRDLVTGLLAWQHKGSSWIAYHLVSLALYLGTIIFFYLTLRLLLCRINDLRGLRYWRWGAVAATGIFAFHPGHVEAAAWVSGQKDMLVAFFYLGSIYFYIRRESASRPGVILSLLFYFLALGSKPSAVSLPLALIFYDNIFRNPGRDWAPFLKRLPVYLVYMFPAIAAVFYFSFTTASLGLGSGMKNILIQMGKISGALYFSAAKLILPVNLCLRYPGFQFEGLADPKTYLYPAAALLMIYWAAWCYLKRKPYALFIIWAILALLPNANLVPIRIERADRYYYLSSIGFCSLAGYAYAWLAGSLEDQLIPWLRGLLILMLISLGMLTFQQVGCWRDGPSAWGRAFELYPDLTLARVGLGHSYLRQGELDSALRIYQPLLERPVPNLEALKGAVDISIRRGQLEKAKKLLQIGHNLAPADEEFAESLARIYMEEGRYEDSEQIILNWLDSSPGSQRAWISLSRLRQRQGREKAAVQSLKEALEINPNNPEACNLLAMIYLRSEKIPEAEKLLQKALAAGRHSKITRLNLAFLYSRSGRREKAVEIYSRYPDRELDLRGMEFLGSYYFERNDLEAALRYFLLMAADDSTLPRAYNNAGVVYENMGRYAGADSMYLKAIALDSAYVDAYFNRGNLLFTLGDFISALHCYQRADSLSGGTDQAITGALIRTCSALGDTAQARRYAARPGSPGRSGKDN